MYKLLLTTLVACLWVSAASGQTTIGFDSVEQQVSIAGYTEGGIVFGDESNFEAPIMPDSGRIPSNGTPYLSSCGICIPSLEAEGAGSSICSVWTSESSSSSAPARFRSRSRSRA